MAQVHNILNPDYLYNQERLWCKEKKDFYNNINLLILFEEFRNNLWTLITAQEILDTIKSLQSGKAERFVPEFYTKKQKMANLVRRLTNLFI